MGAEDTGDEAERSQMASCYQSSVTRMKHGLFSDCSLLVLDVACNGKKNLIVVDLLVRNNFQAERGNIKKQLIYQSAKEEGRRLGLQWDCLYLRHDLKTHKTRKRWLLV